MVLAQSMIGTFGLSRKSFLMALHGHMTWDEALEVEVSLTGCVVSSVTIHRTHLRCMLHEAR